MALTPLTQYNLDGESQKPVRYAKSKLLLLGGSIIAGLKRYYSVWKNYFTDTLCFGIGGDSAENVFLISMPINFNFLIFISQKTTLRTYYYFMWHKQC